MGDNSRTGRLSQTPTKHLLLSVALFLALAACLATGARANQNTQQVATGFFVSDAGYLVTAHHVIAGLSDIRVVMSPRQVLRARTIKVDEQSDLALLKVDAITPFDQKVVHFDFEWRLASGPAIGDHGSVARKGRMEMFDKASAQFVGRAQILQLHRADQHHPVARP